MYSDKEYEAIRAQQRKRWILLAIPAALLLAEVIYTASQRLRLPCMAASILLGVLLIAGWELAIKPLHSYETYLQGALRGPSHQVPCVFKGFEADESLVEGVRYIGMNVSCVDDDGKPYDRLFYFDAEKPLPPWHAGQHLNITYHDRMVVDAETL